MDRLPRKALERDRISFGDLRRLQRTVLPHGLLTREQAEVLIALEQTITRTDKAWAGYLVTVLKEPFGTSLLDANHPERVIAAHPEIANLVQFAATEATFADALRLAIGGVRTEQRHVDEAWSRIRHVAQQIGE